MPAVHTLKCWFLIVLAGALCYLNALGNGFVFDDSAYLSSPLVHQFRPLATFLQSSIHPDLYRPLTLLSLACDFRCYGDQPLGYHLSSLFLHLLNALLVFQLSSHILARQSAALLAALFYALHPLQTEVVSWISSRGDLLMSFFFLAGLLCHIRARTYRGRVLAWFLYGCSILSKESGFVLPAVAYCYDALFAAPARPFRHLFTFTRAWLVRHWGYALVLALALALRWNAAEGGRTDLCQLPRRRRCGFSAADAPGYPAALPTADRLSPSPFSGLLLRFYSLGADAARPLLYRLVSSPLARSSTCPCVHFLASIGLRPRPSAGSPSCPLPTS